MNKYEEERKTERDFDDIMTPNPVLELAHKNRGNDKNDLVNAIYWLYKANVTLDIISGLMAYFVLGEKYSSKKEAKERKRVDEEIIEAFERLAFQIENAEKSLSKAENELFNNIQLDFHCRLYILRTKILLEEISKNAKYSDLDHSNDIQYAKTKYLSVKNNFSTGIQFSQLSQSDKDKMKIEESVQKKKSWIPKGFK